MPPELKQARELSKLFKDPLTGKPLELTPGQQQIFDAIVLKQHPRNIFLAPTRYGKSMTVALAVDVCLIVDPEPWTIVAPSEKQAQVIMGHVISHLFDNPIFTSMLPGNESLERLKSDRTRNSLSLKGGSSIKILTADARAVSRGGRSLLSFGSKNLILDESSLYPDEIYAQALRMLGDNPDHFLVELGNPFFRNHFLESWEDHNYNRIFIDYKQAIAEGRFTEEYIAQMQTKENFGVLYECKFPPEDAIDRDGFQRLFTSTELSTFYVPKSFGRNCVLGIDVGDGGDNSSIIKKTPQTQSVLFDKPLADPMALVRLVTEAIERYEPLGVAVDRTGVGAGVYARLNELKQEEGWDCEILGVHFGQAADDVATFANKRAEMHWTNHKWVLGGGRMVSHPSWKELLVLKWKETTGKKIIFESKKKGIRSPNVADAAALTQVFNIELLARQRERPRGRFYDKTADIWRNS